MASRLVLGVALLSVLLGHTSVAAQATETPTAAQDFGSPAQRPQPGAIPGWEPPPLVLGNHETTLQRNPGASRMSGTNALLWSLAATAVPVAVGFQSERVIGPPAPQEARNALRALAFIAGLGSVIYDIVTAPGSARLHNERNPGASRKSGTNALLWSLAATAVPVAVGFQSEQLWPIVAGLVVGPSVGHWFAGRSGRGWATVGIRVVSAVGVIPAELFRF